MVVICGKKICENIVCLAIGINNMKISCKAKMGEGDKTQNDTMLRKKERKNKCLREIFFSKIGYVVKLSMLDLETTCSPQPRFEKRLDYSSTIPVRFVVAADGRIF